MTHQLELEHVCALSHLHDRCLMLRLEFFHGAIGDDEVVAQLPNLIVKLRGLFFFLHCGRVTFDLRVPRVVP